MNNRIPTSLRMLQGNPSKRPLPQFEPQPELGAEMPSDLSPEAQKVWPKIAKQLTDAGVLTRMDQMALALYCESYSRWRHANEQIVRYGVVIKTPSNFPVQSPFLAIANKAHEQMVKLLTEFGMTPAARTKVHAVQRDREEQPKPAAAYFT